MLVSGVPAAADASACVTRLHESTDAMWASDGLGEGDVLLEELLLDVLLELPQAASTKAAAGTIRNRKLRRTWARSLAS